MGNYSNANFEIISVWLCLIISRTFLSNSGKFHKIKKWRNHIQGERFTRRHNKTVLLLERILHVIGATSKPTYCSSFLPNASFKLFTGWFNDIGRGIRWSQISNAAGKDYIFDVWQPRSAKHNAARNTFFVVSYVKTATDKAVNVLDSNTTLWAQVTDNEGGEKCQRSHKGACLSDHNEMADSIWKCSILAATCSNPWVSIRYHAARR